MLPATCSDPITPLDFAPSLSPPTSRYTIVRPSRCIRFHVRYDPEAHVVDGLPGLVGEPIRRPASFRSVSPGAATHNPVSFGRGVVTTVTRRVGIGAIRSSRPFSHVAMHVAKSPAIWTIAANVNGHQPAVVEASSEDTIVADGAAKDDQAMTTVDQMPSIVGGINAVAQSIVYPEEAKEERIEGKVLVTFVVEPDGSVSNAEVTKGVDPRLDAAALRAVESIAFEPGFHEGEAARVQMTLPISFKLN